MTKKATTTRKASSKKTAPVQVLELVADPVSIKPLVDGKGVEFVLYPKKDVKKTGPVFSKYRITLDSPLGPIEGLIWQNTDKGEAWVGQLKLVRRSARLENSLKLVANS